MNSKYYDINSPGYSIKAKIYYKTDFRSITRVILSIHGFAGHKDSKASERFAEFIISKYKNAAVLCFDLPCHGTDVRKKLSLQECDVYLQKVISDTEQRFGTDELYVYATSFGGYLTLKYIRDNGNPFRRIALRCPALKMHEVMLRSVIKRGELDALEAGKDALIGFDRKILVSYDFIRELQDNDIFGYSFIDYADDIFICHGTKDEVVPIEDSLEFCDNNVIEFSKSENADHRYQDRVIMDLAINQCARFLNL